VPGEQRVAVSALDAGLAQQAQAEGRPHERPRIDPVIAFRDCGDAKFAPGDFREVEAMAGGAILRRIR